MAQAMNVHKQSSIGSIVMRDEGRRPVYVASMDTTNMYALALADIIFWTDQVREHCKFMEMLLPAEDYPEQRERAVMLRGVFEMLFNKARDTELVEDDIRALSELVMPQTEAVISFKRELLDDQRSGKIHSLIFPLFLDHIAREAERFVARQKAFLEGTPQFDRDEIIDFWSRIMAEHASFVAHLLDPTEVDLINKALEYSETFKRIQQAHPIKENTDPVTMDVDHLIDFKTAATKGVDAAQIQSIITPELADHIRREAIKFADELRRADTMMGIQPMAAA